jgi:hypothetical protein
MTLSENVKWILATIIGIIIAYVIAQLLFYSKGKQYCMRCRYKSSKESCDHCSNCAWKKGLLAGEGCVSNIG